MGAAPHDAKHGPIVTPAAPTRPRRGGYRTRADSSATATSCPPSPRLRYDCRLSAWAVSPTPREHGPSSPPPPPPPPCPLSFPLHRHQKTRSFHPEGQPVTYLPRRHFLKAPISGSGLLFVTATTGNDSNWTVLAVKHFRDRRQGCLPDIDGEYCSIVRNCHS